MKKLKVVLDLECTLVATKCVWIENKTFDNITTFDTSSYISKHTFVNKITKIRPGLVEFLDYVHKNYDCYVMTNSIKIHGQSVVEKIEELLGKKIFIKSFYIENTFGIKDLTQIDYDLKRIVLIDDDKCNFIQSSNGILIKPFTFDSTHDLELENIKQVLNALNLENDVRTYIREHSLYTKKRLLDYTEYDMITG